MRYGIAEPQQFFYVGYRIPILGVTIRDENGTVVNLTGMTLAFVMYPEGSTTAKVDFAAMAIVVAASGTCSYSWASGDVDTAGFYVCHVRIGTLAANFELTHPFGIEFKNPYDHILQRR